MADGVITASEVELNGQKVTKMDMRQWISGKINPDGSEISEWLSQTIC